MRGVMELGRALACLIFCGLLVLLVPSAAWSADGETPSSEPSPSSSPVPDSASSSPVPQSQESPVPPESGESSGSSAPEPVQDQEVSTEVEPTAPETVYVVTEPPAPEALAAETGEGPMVVPLSDEDRALVGLAACLLALGVGARIVGSFA